MTPSPKTQALEALIEAHATELKLPTVKRRFRQLAAEATREQQTPVAYLAALLEAEMAERAERREKRRLIDARFPLIKRLEEFRFADNPKVPQATIAALADGSWIDDRESIVFVGESGSGKTHLATALAVCACQQGRRVRFTTLAALANELQEAESRRELGRVVGRYARTELVCLDELGYLNLPAGAAELVFQVISERNERGSLIVTTNLSFGDWTKVFPDPRLAKAVVDRITHKAHIIDTGTESWRFRHGLERQGRKRALTSRPADAPAAIATKPLALRAQAFASTAAVSSPRGDQATSPPTTTDAKWGATSNVRGGATANGRTQTATRSVSRESSSLMWSRWWWPPDATWRRSRGLRTRQTGSTGEFSPDSSPLGCWRAAGCRTTPPGPSVGVCSAAHSSSAHARTSRTRSMRS
jgi:DNA replication protein DnaC